MKRTIIDLVEWKWERCEIDFIDDNWRNNVPSGSGWYYFETNIPPAELIKVNKPKGSNHYDIPERVKAAVFLEKYQATIVPKKTNALYVVYFGEAANLKSRAREHISGHIKTGCLALKNYSNLHSYKWFFNYSLVSSKERIIEDKLLRTIGENLWRAKYGWPILCSQ